LANAEAKAILKPSTRVARAETDGLAGTATPATRLVAKKIKILTVGSGGS